MNQIKTCLLCEADCKSILDGYHLNVWEEICSIFNRDPDEVDTLEFSLNDVHYK